MVFGATLAQRPGPSTDRTVRPVGRRADDASNEVVDKGLPIVAGTSDGKEPSLTFRVSLPSGCSRSSRS